MTQAQSPSQSGLISGTWNIDAIHSQVMVSTRHMAVTSLRAKFPKVSGRLQVDAADPLRSSFEAEIDTGSVTTGHPAQEDFIRSEPWLDAANHPSITFRSTAVEPAGDSRYLIRGDLTLKDQTRQVEIPVEFHGVISDPWGLRTGFTSRFTVDRRDFGITWNRVFDWGAMAGNEMEISLDIELVYPDESRAQKPQA